MAKNATPSPRETIPNLTQDVYDDLEKLIGQHVQLLGHELKDDLKKAVAAGASFGGGAGLLALGTILGGQATVYLLHRITGLPLWLCYAGCSATACAVGAGLLATGAAQVSDIELIPKETAREVKKTVASVVS